MLNPSDIRPTLARFDLYDDDKSLAWICINLAPFTFEGQTFSTEFRLDDITGLDDRLQQSAGKAFAYPINPVPGYIDGTLYFYGCHHSVDVTYLDFGLHQGNTVPLRLRGALLIEEHGPLHSVPLDFETCITLKATPEQIAHRVDAAILETGSTHPKHLGKMMTHLRPFFLYPEEAATYATAITQALAKTANTDSTVPAQTLRNHQPVSNKPSKK